MPVFVTWRLAGSLPVPDTPVAPGKLEAVPSGRRFVAADRALDRDASGPRWLADARMAGMVTEALLYGEAGRHLYQLYAYAVMPNHVHVVWQPHTDMARIMDWLKGATARRANRMLGRRTEAFWQAESFDHWIRSDAEMRRIIGYVERNPVTAGLAARVEDWPWSSAARYRQTEEAAGKTGCPTG
jgi:putative transposase